MKLIALLFAAVFAVAAQQVPYQATSGDLTIYVLDWSNVSPLTALPSLPVTEVRGIFLTACTKNSEIPSLKAVVTYRSKAGMSTRVEDLGKLQDMNNGSRCASTVVPILRRDIANLSIVLASIDFGLN